jgi:hypothetical protein
MQCSHLNPFAGKTYTRGAVPGAGVKRKKKTTCSEDMNYISQLENDQFFSNFGYGFRSNCRTYSQMVFDEAPGIEYKWVCLEYEYICYASSGGFAGCVRVCKRGEWQPK